MRSIRNSKRESFTVQCNISSITLSPSFRNICFSFNKRPAYFMNGTTHVFYFATVVITCINYTRRFCSRSFRQKPRQLPYLPFVDRIIQRYWPILLTERGSARQIIGKYNKWISEYLERRVAFLLHSDEWLRFWASRLNVPIDFSHHPIFMHHETFICHIFNILCNVPM